MQNSTVALSRGDHPALAPADFADRLMAAREADHLAHCTPCRERHEEAEARYAKYGESMRRRDRIQLGLHSASTPAR